MLNKKYLKRYVLSLLAIGTLGMAMPVQAEIVDMTAAGNVGGVTIADPTDDVNNVYLYKWDKTTNTLTGGTITAKSNKNSQSLNLHLQLKATDFENLSVATIKKATDSLATKVINELPENRYSVYAYVEIVNEKGEIARKYTINADNVEEKEGKYEKPSVGIKGDLYGALYTTPLKADGEHGEYELDDKNTWYLVSGDGITIKPEYNTKEKDHIYAAIRGGEKDLTITHVKDNVTSSNTLSIVSEGPKVKDKRALIYGIYQDGKGTLTLNSSDTTVKVKGIGAKGVLVGNDSDSSISHFYMGGQNGVEYNMNVESTSDDEAPVGIETKLNGVLHIKSPDDCKISLNVKKGIGLYAHDGGQIVVEPDTKRSVINIKTDKNDKAVYAEKGGIINVDLGDVDGNIETDTDAKSVITAKVKGTFSGLAKGNVNLTIAKDWDGNFDSSGDLHISDGVKWTGTSSNAEINRLIMDEGAFWGTPYSGPIPIIKNLTVSKSALNRSYIDMGQKNITIDKLSGNITFIYAHSLWSPTDITGGNVHIKSAAPLEIVSEGIEPEGNVQKKKTVKGTIPSTICVLTNNVGIYNDDGLALSKDQVNEVLDNLAKKVYYDAYVTGERNLTGTVAVAEGLTTSGLYKILSPMSWDKATGQGHRAGITKYPYSAFIYGNPADEKAYKKVITNEDGKLTYTFNEDTCISNKIMEDPRPFAFGALYVASINNFGDKKSGVPSKGGPSFTVDMKGHNLYIETDANAPGTNPMWHTAGIAAFREGTITFDNPGAIDIHTSANYFYACGIQATCAQVTDKGTHVVINNDNKKRTCCKDSRRDSYSGVSVELSCDGSFYAIE